jgi:hypothetical protein
MGVDATHQTVMKVDGSRLTMANADSFLERSLRSFPRDEIWLSNGRTSVQSESADTAIVLATAITYVASAAIMLRLVGWLLSVL